MFLNIFVILLFLSFFFFFFVLLSYFLLIRCVFQRHFTSISQRDEEAPTSAVYATRLPEHLLGTFRAVFEGAFYFFHAELHAELQVEI